MGEIEIKSENSVLAIDFLGINVVCIEIGNFKKTILTEDRISLKDVEVGKHKVKVVLINNLRNLMDPRHLQDGECISVLPRSFYEERGVWYLVE